MDFDAVFEKCGTFGRYQWRLMLLFGFSNIFCSMHYFSQTIITFTPEHWCDQAELFNSSVDEVRDFYKDSVESTCAVVDGTNASTVKCSKWIYDYEKNFTSIATELNWVCDRAMYSTIGQSFFFVGSVLGTIVFGYLADRIGRLPAMLLSSLSGALGDFLTSFIQSLMTFTVARFISGLSSDTNFYLMYIIVFEYLDPRRRTFGLNIVISIFYATGLALTPWLAVWLNDWRLFLQVSSTMTIAVVLYPLLIVESAQWLITKQRLPDAVACLKRVAHVNGCHVEDDVFQKFEDFYKAKDKAVNSDSFVGLFRTPRLRKFTLILLLKSIFVTMSYDVTNKNMQGFGISPFELFSYTSLAYVPAGLTVIASQQIIGRRGTACASFLLGALLTIATGVAIALLNVDENRWLLFSLVALSRFVGIVVYDAEAQYAAEMVPASIRGQAVSNIHLIGYAFNFTTAYIIFLGESYRWLPWMMVSAAMLMGAVISLLLPETLNKPLPQNLADGEEFGKNEKLKFFINRSFKTKL